MRRGGFEFRVWGFLEQVEVKWMVQSMGWARRRVTAAPIRNRLQHKTCTAEHNQKHDRSGPE